MSTKPVLKKGKQVNDPEPVSATFTEAQVQSAVLKAKLEIKTELERTTKELQAALSQLRRADEEIERVWVDKMNLEKDLRSQLDSREQQLAESERRANEFSLLAKTKEEWCNDLEIQLKTALTSPDDSVLEKELKSVKADLAQLTASFELEKSSRMKTEDKAAVLERSVSRLTTENESFCNDLKQAEARLVQFNVVRKELEEIEAVKMSLESRLETTNRDRLEISRQLGLVTEQLSQTSMRLRSHFTNNAPPDFESQRVAKESTAALELQRQETARYSAEVTRLTEQLRELKCSTIDWLSAENERLKRKSVEAARLLSEEQTVTAELKAKSSLFSELEAEREQLRAELEISKKDASEKHTALSGRIDDLQKENSAQKIRIDKFKEIQAVFGKSDVLSGLQALSSLTQTVGALGK